MKLTSLLEVIKFKIHHFSTVSFVHNFKKILRLYKFWAPSHPDNYISYNGTQQHLWALSMDLAAYQPSGTCTSEVVSRFFENLCTAVT
jgi:hypothetical protein